jgi:protein-L-isoaspartate(D-aspartate) O-methyltransferase
VLDSDLVTSGSGVTVARQEPYDSLQLYLAAVLPSTASLVFASPGAGRDLPDPQAGFPVCIYGGGTIAYVATCQDGQGDSARFEFVACGLGPEATKAAGELRDLVREWDATIRAERVQPRVTIVPSPRAAVPGPRRYTLRKTHTTVVLAYADPPEAGCDDAGGNGEATGSPV